MLTFPVSEIKLKAKLYPKLKRVNAREPSGRASVSASILVGEGDGYQ